MNLNKEVTAVAPTAEAHDLQVSYGKQPVLKNLNWKLMPGQVVVESNVSAAPTIIARPSADIADRSVAVRVGSCVHDAGSIGAASAITLPTPSSQARECSR